MGQFILKRDSLKLGLALGLLGFILGVAAFYFYKFSSISLKEFYFYVKTNTQLLTAMSAICTVINVGILTYYLNTKKDQTAKGIFAITFLLAVVVLVIKFFL